MNNNAKNTNNCMDGWIIHQSIIIPGGYYMSKFKPGDHVRLKSHKHIHGMVEKVIDDAGSDTKYDVGVYPNSNHGIYLESSLERDTAMEAYIDGIRLCSENKRLRMENQRLKEDIDELVRRIVEMERDKKEYV